MFIVHQTAFQMPNFQFVCKIFTLLGLPGHDYV